MYGVYFHNLYNLFRLLPAFNASVIHVKALKVLVFILLGVKLGIYGRALVKLRRKYLREVILINRNGSSRTFATINL